MLQQSEERVVLHFQIKTKKIENRSLKILIKSTALNKESQVGSTEVVTADETFEFLDNIKMQFYFEVRQFLKFIIINDSNQEIGICKSTLSEILGSQKM